MPLYPPHQPLNRGFTLVELIIAAATAGVIALVSTMLFKAAIVTYMYTMRQSAALSSARTTLMGDGSKFGILWEAQSADYVTSLSATQLGLASSGTVTAHFRLQGDDLYKIKSGATTTLAGSIDSMAIGYYNLDASGLIMESTATASATYVTALLTMRGNTDNDKVYRFFTGARLRNHP